MNAINQWNLEPGVWRHHKGEEFVVLEIANYLENADSGDMEHLEDPFVVYRDLNPAKEHIQGKLRPADRRFMMRLSEFRMIMPDGKPRFVKI